MFVGNNRFASEANYYINNSRHLARKYARIFVRGHSVPRSEQFSEREARGKL